MILKPTSDVEDWKQLLAKPDLHWKPGGSAMETAFSWQGAGGLPREIQALLPQAELLFAIPEYKVQLPGGARESQNDVFALARDDTGLIVIMVEAKRDEPFGPTVGDWFKTPTTGKQTRLEYLADILHLNSSQLKTSIRYQLLHRAASAVLTARKFHARRCVMVVQSFSPEHRWFEDYATLCSIFGEKAEREKLSNPQLLDQTSLSFAWVNSLLKTV